MRRIAGVSRVRVVLAGVGVAVLSGCAMSPKPVVMAADACAAKRFDVYFQDSHHELTPAARQAISLTATALQSCRITSVRVLGLSDARGGAAANLSLSQQRARSVAEALEAAGWPAPAFDVAAAGDEGAASGGVSEPLRRRTEVLVEATPL